ncbi:MarR family winged helix-turn-helix transcriptional regulator [Candidimonas humi]|uniref:MarR family winged helix-turn-helix transcriptional regulator n=1 Tax=Candidimonas humi TaxID=683355 RepID=A0ABV8P426_9BURK|nr:MarR family winged helix-turn-helix transcriptional regulator [Candidimonas humi]
MNEELESEPAALVLGELFSFQVRRFNVLYTRASTLVYGRDFGLKLNEWRVLAAVMSHGEHPPSMGDLVQETGLDYGLASRLVGALVERGLALREPSSHDARARAVELTVEGRLLARRVLQVAVDRNARLTAVLEPGQLRVLNTMMEALIHNAELMLLEDQALRSGR